ncbi:MAG: hypothetical protein K8F91_21540, partial [Candidatus Obscuribacterales bacterium]|nr:hypothetical protein [Candidatus Obscuribacterales bacterium]
MTKTRSKWVCQECGYQSTGYLGKCTDCQSWGSMLEETVVVDETTGSFKGGPKQSRFANQEADNQPLLLNEIETICSERVST